MKNINEIKDMEALSEDRALGRTIARELTAEEIKSVAGAASKGYTDSGSGVSADCDMQK